MEQTTSEPVVKILSIEDQEKIDIAMGYFHPEEKIFSKETQEEKMLETLKILSKALGISHEKVIELRGAWFARDKGRMYSILNKYITF